MQILVTHNNVTFAVLFGNSFLQEPYMKIYPLTSVARWLFIWIAIKNVEWKTDNKELQSENIEWKCENVVWKFEKMLWKKFW